MKSSRLYTEKGTPIARCLPHAPARSFLEIYNEVITDLLRPCSTGLNIRDGDIKRGVYVEDLSETNVLNGACLAHVGQGDRGAAWSG
jgi:hypothetical protein